MRMRHKKKLLTFDGYFHINVDNLMNSSRMLTAKEFVQNCASKTIKYIVQVTAVYQQFLRDLKVEGNFSGLNVSF